MVILTVIDDRCMSRRALSIIKEALETTGNVPVNLALSVFDKQIAPI